MPDLLKDVSSELFSAFSIFEVREGPSKSITFQKWEPEIAQIRTYGAMGQDIIILEVLD